MLNANRRLFTVFILIFYFDLELFLAAGFLAAGFLAAGFLAAGFFDGGFFDGGFFDGIIRQET